MKLPMSDSEIIISYKQAKNKNSQIGVLAELNACKKQETVDILTANNAISGLPSASAKKQAARWDPEQRRELLRLRDEEKLTWTQIGERMGMTDRTVQQAYTRTVKKREELMSWPDQLMPAEVVPELVPEPKPGSEPDQTFKADAGKLQISLVPPQIIRDIALVRAYGNQKYSDSNNWRQVQMQRYIDALLRHTLDFVEDPASVDPESGIEHYKHMACNMAFLCEMMKEVD